MNIIAEIGWNWMGDMNLAKQMIKAAADNGATHVKTQVFNESRLKPGPWDEDGRREIYKKAQPSYDQLVEMKKYCEKQGVVFMASAMSVLDAKLYLEVTSDIIKIPGFESRNFELLSFATTNFDKIVISIGTSSIEEIREVLLRLPNEAHKKVVLLHCISSYPCLPENANLPKMHQLVHLLLELPGATGNVETGFSDHIQGVESAKVALEYNIQWIEKHFTVDRSLPGRDNKFAILPEELKDLTDYIKLREKMLVSHGDGFLECEVPVREIQTGRFNK